MSFAIRQPHGDGASDLAAMADFAAGQQHDHRYHVMYLGMTAESIATDVAELEDWASCTVIAEDDGRMAGWLVAELDRDMGRVWWMGPFAVPGQTWDSTADQMYRRAMELLPVEVTEQEAAADDRGGSLTDWCVRHRFTSNTASVLLRLEPDQLIAPSSEHLIRPLADGDHEAVKALHGFAFPGTHTTPEALVVSEHPRLVLESEPGTIAGYVAFEMQSDGSGYVDFLAVDNKLRGSGFGGALVAESCRRMLADDASFVHLTVREDNAPARALYARLGFAEERVVRPYRIGFDLG